MSHFSKIKTRMVDKEFILKALADLGYQTEEGDLTIRGFGQAQLHVEIKARAKRFGRDIGLRKNGETYEVIADWWGVSGTTRGEFVDKLAQRYAYHATRSKLAEQGFDLVSEEVGEKGQVHLVLRRMA